jgi:threonine dehydrogenase-like Zn-dependent dehydrogenase
MRALVWHGPERMSVEEVPAPQPRPGEVLVVPEAVGICGSEVEGFLGHQANRTPPLIMGHEFAGRITAAGDDAHADWVGRRAAVNPLVPDPGARPGLENLGARRQLLGVHRPGGFAGAVAVPASQLRALPDGADVRLGALAEPLANGVHAVRIAQDGAEGDASATAVVLGAGPIGLMVLQEARLAGLGWIGSLEPQPARRAAAADIGAHATFATADEARDAVREVTNGEGADLVLDAVGVVETRRLAIELVRPGGCALMLGLAHDTTPLDFHGLIRAEITVRGSYAYTAADYDIALEHLLDSRVGLGELEPVGSLDDGPAAFAELARGPSSRFKVFLAPDAA